MSGSRSETAWRWALRLTGMLVFLTCAITFVLGRDVPIALLLVAAGCMGLDSLQGFEVKRRGNGG